MAATNAEQLARARGFSDAHGAPEVWAVFSGDGGASFGSPVRVDGGRPLGRVDVALRADGSAVVVWLEAAGTNGAEVRARGVSPEGPQGEALCLGRTHSGRPSGIPRVARWNGGLYAAWTETDGRIRRAPTRILTRAR